VRYRCPVCKVEAERVERTWTIYVEHERGESFPLHPDCELAKAKPDPSKLEEV